MAKGEIGRTKKCPKCGGMMVSEALEWKCLSCGYVECIEPEYCPPKDKKK